MPIASKARGTTAALGVAQRTRADNFCSIVLVAHVNYTLGVHGAAALRGEIARRRRKFRAERWQKYASDPDDPSA